MTEHTPGPWRIGSLKSWDAYTGMPFRNVWAGDSDDENHVIARAINEDDVDANARLIAAAPCLLAACEAVLSQLDYLRGLWGDEAITRGLADQVRAAAARAKGEDA